MDIIGGSVVVEELSWIAVWIETRRVDRNTRSIRQAIWIVARINEKSASCRDRMGGDVAIDLNRDADRNVAQFQPVALSAIAILINRDAIVDRNQKLNRTSSRYVAAWIETRQSSRGRSRRSRSIEIATWIETSPAAFVMRESYQDLSVAIINDE